MVVQGPPKPLVRVRFFEGVHIGISYSGSTGDSESLSSCPIQLVPTFIQLAKWEGWSLQKTEHLFDSDIGFQKQIFVS